VLFDGNDTNDYNTSTPSSSLSASTAATAVVLIRYGMIIHNKSPSSPSLCIPVLSDWVPVRLFFPFVFVRFSSSNWLVPSISSFNSNPVVVQ